MISDLRRVGGFRRDSALLHIVHATVFSSDASAFFLLICFYSTHQINRRIDFFMFCIPLLSFTCVSPWHRMEACSSVLLSPLFLLSLLVLLYSIYCDSTELRIRNKTYLFSEKVFKCGPFISRTEEALDFRFFLMKSWMIFLVIARGSYGTNVTRFP